MSDIVIKGMELPKDPIDYLHLIIQDGKVHTAISCGHLTTDKLNVADAIEVPTPHGDLIDAHAFATKVAEAQDKVKGKDYDPFMLLGDVLRWIELAPVVIEASK